MGDTVTGVGEFSPDWCLAPSAPLREWLEEKNMTPEAFAAASAGPRNEKRALGLVMDVLERRPLGEEHARYLAAAMGVSAQFWRNYERNYREGLAAGLTDVTGDR